MNRHVLRLAVGLLAVACVWAPATVLANPSEASQGKGSTAAIQRQVKAQLGLLSHELMPGCGMGEDPRPAVRERQKEAIQELARLGPAVVPVLMPHWTKGSSKLRGNLVHIFAQVGDATSRKLVFQALEDRNGHVQAEAVTALASMQPLPPEAFPRLIKLSSRQDRWAASIAMSELTRLLPLQPEPTRRQLLKQLGVLLQNKSDMTRSGALKAVATVAPGMPEAVTVLLRALADRSSMVRYDAVEAVSRWKEQASVVVPALQPLAEDPDPRVRIRAISGLAAFDGAQAPRYLPTAQAVLADPKSAAVRNDALLFLAQWGTPGDVALVARALEQGAGQEQQLIQQLAQLENPRPELVTLLGTLLRRPPARNATSIASLFGRAERNAGLNPTQKALATTLGKQGRLGAMELLRVLGPENDEQLELTRIALLGLRVPIAETPEEIVPLVLDRLHRDAAGELSSDAVQALALGGPRAVQLTEAWATQGPSRRKQLVALLKQAVQPKGP
jgi:HEAT repeat protein